MEADPTRVCELLVRLGDVELVGIDDLGEGTPLEVVIGSRLSRPMCEGCGGGVWSKVVRASAAIMCSLVVNPARERPMAWDPLVLRARSVGVDLDCGAVQT